MRQSSYLPYMMIFGASLYYPTGGVKNAFYGANMTSFNGVSTGG